MSDYKLYCGDCLEILPTLPQVDAVITDPPYGIGESGKKNNTRSNLAAVKDYGDYRWDSERVGRKCIELMRNTSKHQIIFGGNFYADLLPASSSWIVWDKNNSGDFADCELVWTSYKKAVRKFKWTWNGFIREQLEERFHPTQKPIALMRWIIENYTQFGDTILDPYMGSGTTGVAAMLTGRNFIGVELDADYYAIAERRIADAARQARGEFRHVTDDADHSDLPLLAETNA